MAGGGLLERLYQIVDNLCVFAAKSSQKVLVCQFLETCVILGGDFKLFPKI
jgi:hypothetical protein